MTEEVRTIRLDIEPYADIQAENSLDLILFLHELNMLVGNEHSKTKTLRAITEVTEAVRTLPEDAIAFAGQALMSENKQGATMMIGMLMIRLGELPIEIVKEPEKYIERFKIKQFNDYVGYNYFESMSVSLDAMMNKK